MRRGLLYVLFVVSILPAMSWAQSDSKQNRKDRFEVSGGIGWATFPDEGPLHHFTATGAARFRIIGGLGIAPEMTFMYHSAADKDWVFVPNVVYEFRRHAKVVPYLIGGIGVLRHYESQKHFDFAANGPSYGVGFGTKIFVTSRVFVAPEVRLGWEPAVRAGAAVGYILAP